MVSYNLEDLPATKQVITALIQRLTSINKYLSIADKKMQLEELELELENPNIWQNNKKAQLINKKKSSLVNIISTVDNINSILTDSAELLQMSIDEKNLDTIDNIIADINLAKTQIIQLEFSRMFTGKMDINNAFVEIQSGSGGTEAQDWAQILLRMYLRFIDKKGWQVKLMEVSNADVAGIKSATIYAAGEHAFGWLKSETGIHRLVRKSPFNASGKRHTSFASVFVSPEVNDDIIININPSDLRTDTYRASGAGGQHVNKTESAVRITHLPTNTVVQCQDGRSQHSNKEQAMKQLKSKLYELEVQKKNTLKQDLENSKSDIGWGQQIRSYVLDDSRIKDLRTGIEVRNTNAVLDGDLDIFIKAALKQK